MERRLPMLGLGEKSRCPDSDLHRSSSPARLSDPSPVNNRSPLSRPLSRMSLSRRYSSLDHKTGPSRILSPASLLMHRSISKQNLWIRSSPLQKFSTPYWRSHLVVISLCSSVSLFGPAMSFGAAMSSKTCPSCLSKNALLEAFACLSLGCCCFTSCDLSGRPMVLKAIATFLVSSYAALWHTSVVYQILSLREMKPRIMLSTTMSARSCACLSHTNHASNSSIAVAHLPSESRGPRLK